MPTGIDDHEQANLKLLCDNVFGADNFVGTIIHQRAKGGGQAKHIVKGHDYIHVYSRKISEAHISRKKEIEITPRMKLIDGRYFVKNDDVIRKSFGKYDKSMDRRCFYEELIFGLLYPKFCNSFEMSLILNKVVLFSL